MFRKIVFVVCTAVLAPAALGQITVPAADGSDGAFNPTGSSFVVDLSKAVTATWDTPGGDMDGDGFGDGVYDPEKWAVVFKYSSVNIPGGTTVRFINHGSRAPVVWLVAGDVSIHGTISLKGGNGATTAFAEPGPGGFRSGLAYLSGSNPGSAGFGPGGGRTANLGPASYATLGTRANAGPIYGNDAIIPLIGGSGSTMRREVIIGGISTLFPGAGGGAILIALTTTLTLNGAIVANGGDSPGDFRPGFGGSGGAIRVIADSIVGTGSLRARVGRSGAGGGAGRIRVQANSIALSDPGDPPFMRGVPGNPILLWLPPNKPRVSLATIDNMPVPSDPRASFGLPTDVSITTAAPVSIIVNAQNVPLDWVMNVRVVPIVGNDSVFTAAPLSGSTVTSSTWEAMATFSAGVAAVQVRAVAP